MICQWNKLTAILPPWISRQLDGQAAEMCQDIRLRLNERPLLNLGRESKYLTGTLGQEDLNHVIRFASHYSPWAASTIKNGYLTAPGGHRIGVCGEAIVNPEGFQGIRSPRSLCIRVARDFPGIGEKLRNVPDSLLILGAPGWGKTTLLRDLIRQKALCGPPVAVVDEREELFPQGICECPGVDILSGCPKQKGIEILLKTMGPGMIAVDEITSREDARALLHCSGCGVALLATIHAADISDLSEKEFFRPFLEQKVFKNLVVMHPDKSWHLERGGLCR